RKAQKPALSEESTGFLMFELSFVDLLGESHQRNRIDF
ncbi:hypothetical protein EVA_21417, partial [gut metagenome]